MDQRHESGVVNYTPVKWIRIHYEYLALITLQCCSEIFEKLSKYIFSEWIEHKQDQILVARPKFGGVTMERLYIRAASETAGVLPYIAAGHLMERRS